MNFARSKKLLAASLLVLTACSSNGELEKKDAELNQLRGEVATLKSELDDLKNGPSRLYESSNALFKQAKYREALTAATTLIAKHPGAPEAKKITTIKSQAEAKLAALAAAKKAEELAKKRAAELKEKQAKQAAEAAKRREKERLARALSNMRTKYDSVKGSTWYYDKSSPHFINSRSNLYLYMGKEQGQEPWLLFVNVYVAEDWLFIERFIIKADSQTFDMEPPSYGDGSIERDNGSGGIWEWLDIPASERELEIAEAVANSKHAIIRYEGKQYTKDRVVSSAEKQAIKNILAAKKILTP
jgi:hypothetical protein